MKGSKHAAPPTGYWAEGFTPEQIIEVYRQHHAKQLPLASAKLGNSLQEPLPLNQHPFIRLAESFFGALSLIKVAGPKSA